LEAAEVCLTLSPGGVGGAFELAAGGLPIDAQFSEPMGQVGRAFAVCA
jgi:hypothetical protein